MNDTQLTVAQIIEQAKAENLSNKKIKSLLYHNGHAKNGEAFEAIRESLGREKGNGVDLAEQEAKAAAREQQRQEAAEQQKQRAIEATAAREEREAEDRRARKDAVAKLAAAKSAITNGDVIWCDAAPNSITKVVNRFGKQKKFDNGGYRAGLLVDTEAGRFVSRAVNTRCPDQFAAECWSVLKAVELATEAGLATVTIRNDRIGSFTASTKRGYIGAKYLWIAKQMAEEHSLDVTFELCSSSDNLADKISRSEASK